ncbi:hypothetical protein ACFLVE_01295 [Chloroflexota bacterium]
MSRRKGEQAPKLNPAELLAALPNILSVVLGRAFPPGLATTIVEMEACLPQTYRFIEAMERAKQLPDSSSRKTTARESTDSFIRSFVGNVSPNESPIEHVIKELERIATPPPDLGFLGRASHAAASEALERLVNSAYIHPASVKSFVEAADVASTEPLMAVGQMMSTRVGKRIRLLSRPRTRYTRRIANVCIDVYGDLAGAIEKGLPMVVGLVGIAEGKTADYTQIVGNAFAKNIKAVRVSDYGALAPGFDTITIRNAIAHKSYYFHPVERVVRFEDPPRKASEQLGYKELVVRTSDLCSLVFVIYQVRVKLMIAQMRNIDDILKSAGSPPP